FQILASEAPSTLMTAGDLNADGKTDLVFATLDTNFPGAGTATILMGNGDGTFRPGVPYPVVPSGSSAIGVRIGDFTGDGIPDIAAGFFSGIVAKAGIAPGKGDGTFGVPIA